MACPYLLPTEFLAEGARVPLGDFYNGVCMANPAAPWQPGNSCLKELCNYGYARRSCSRFPHDNGPDAVRFSISKHENNLIQICYALEKNHYPYDHGRLEYSLDARSFSQPCGNEILQAQARAYVESYLRRLR